MANGVGAFFDITVELYLISTPLISYMTTSLLRLHSLDPIVKQHLISLKTGPADMTNLLLQPGFCGPTLVILMGSTAMKFFLVFVLKGGFVLIFHFFKLLQNTQTRKL